MHGAVSGFNSETGLNRRVVIVLLVCTFLGFGLRVFQLDQQSFWTDEIMSVQIAQSPLSDIRQESGRASSLPTYFLALRAVIGSQEKPGEARARALSVLAGVLAIPLLGMLVLGIRGKPMEAYGASLLLAISPLHIWYSQEVRAYALLITAAIAAWLAFEKSRHTGRTRHWFTYVFLAILTVSLHKTGVILLVFFAAVVILEWRVRPLSRNEWMAHAVVMAVSLVLLSLYPSSYAVDRDSSILEIGYTFLTFAAGYSFGPSIHELQSMGTQAAIRANLVQLAMAGVVLIAVALAFMVNLRAVIRSREFLLIAITVSSVFVLSLVSDYAFNIRYTLLALPAFLALVAMACVRSGSKGKVVFALMLLLSGASTTQWFTDGHYGKNDLRGLATWMKQNRQGIEQVLIQPEYLAEFVAWYATDSVSAGVPNWISGELQLEGDNWISPPGLLVLGRKHHVINPGAIVSRFKRQAGAVCEMREFQGLEVYMDTALSGLRLPLDACIEQGKPGSELRE